MCHPPGSTTSTALANRRPTTGAKAHGEPHLQERYSPLEHLAKYPPGPAAHSPRTNLWTFGFPASLAAALHTFSTLEHLSPEVVCLAAYGVLLARYSAQGHIDVGILLTNKHTLALPATNAPPPPLVALSLQLSEGSSFRTVLGQILPQLLHLREGQRTQASTMPQSQAPHSPPALFSFQAQALVDHAQKHVSLAEQLPLTSYVDLALSVQTDGSTVQGTLEYDPDRFDERTMRRMAERWLALVQRTIADPDRPVADLPLLLEDERQERARWNATQMAFPQHTCVHLLFEEQAGRTPDAVAVAYENQKLTYRELNARSNQLAHYLQRVGVGPEVRVGISIQRSLNAIVGLLGILKAGGAYVPLDPTYPAERLSFMLADAQPTVLLTATGLESWRLSPDVLPPHIVDLNADWATIADQPDTNPPSTAGPNNLANVIYTSGSTGRPKGVLVEHYGLCNLAAAQIRAFDVGPASRVLQFASLNFDASISEIIMALLSGAALHLAPQDTLLSGPSLIALLRDQAITTATLPPSVLAALPVEPLPLLRTLIVAGEACSAELVARWSSGRRFLNAYGPTEASVCATIGVCTVDGRPPAIGYPIANTQVHLLDAALQPVPVGMAGELYIGGVGVARGYLNRPALTAERFIPDPFRAEPGARLYKTGDLARYRADGSIEYLGRIDHQVKLRGFRIELGEVEATLSDHPAVQGCAVIAREDAPGQKQLVAYVVPRQEALAVEKTELWPSVAEYFIYDDLLYGAMTNDERRNRSYRVAIAREVPGKVVVEIGTGKDAILARLCIEAGARHVYAIELLEESYLAAQACIRRLGLAGQITLVHGDATTVELPELADVCISEIVGAIGGSEGAAILINSARRFLKPGGVMIPERSITRIAAVRLPDELRDAPAFTELSGHYVHQIFAQVGYPFDLRLCLKHFPRSHVISGAAIFEDLDFTRPISPEYRHEITLAIAEESRLDGFLVWLTLSTTQGELIDILEHQHCWLPVYLPVFDPPLDVKAGDSIAATVSGTLCDNGLNPDYRVSGTVMHADGSRTAFDYDALHVRPSYREKPFYRRLFADGGVPMRVRQASPAAAEIKEHLRRRLPEYMIPSFVVMLDALPLTPNGKIDRAALPAPQAYEHGRAAVFLAPSTPVEMALAQIWTEVLGVAQVGARDNFFELGGDSILCMQVISKAHQLGLQIAARQFFQHPTVAELAAVVGTAPAVAAEQGLLVGPLPLAPIQRWFFEQGFPEPHHWNQTMLLELPQAVDPTLLERSLEVLLMHHDALRLRFACGPSGWTQRYAPAEPHVPFRRIDLSAHSPHAWPAAITAATAQLQASFDLEAGPRLRALFFDLGAEQPGRLCIAINYLAIDGVSWRILLEDLQTAYLQLRRGEPARLPTKTTSYRRWTERLSEYAQSPELEGERAYWQSAVGSGASLPLDEPGGENSEASARSVVIALDQAETRALLHEAPRAYHTQINDILLTALIRAFAGWSGGVSLLINLESHGRADLFDDIDLSRTVGWLTSYYPLLLRLNPDDEPASSLLAVKAQLRGVPRHGVGYSALRYLSADPAVGAALRALPQPRVRFNYLGQFDQVLAGSSLFRRAREAIGAAKSPHGQRDHVLVIEGLVVEGKLHLEWSYSANLHRRPSIERLAALYLTELQGLINHCAAPREARQAHDFPLMYSGEQLSTVFALLDDMDQEELI